MSKKTSIQLEILATMNWIVYQKAQGLMEYALIIVLVAIIVLVVLAILGPGVGNMFSKIVSNV